jgi:hypothetical protein
MPLDTEAGLDVFADHQTERIVRRRERDGGRGPAIALSKRITTSARRTWTGRVGEDRRITVVRGEGGGGNEGRFPSLTPKGIAPRTPRSRTEKRDRLKRFDPPHRRGAHGLRGGRSCRVVGDFQPPVFDALLAYAATGMRVSPVCTNKRPLTEHGLKDAAVLMTPRALGVAGDEERLHRWRA